MPIFLLIRHGDNDYLQTGRLPGRLPGIPLNESGRTVVREVADRLANISVKSIYSSPIERSVETAQIIAENLKIPIEVRDALIEIDCGDWQGKRISDLRRSKQWKTLQSQPSGFRFPGGESFSEAQHRICQEIELLSVQHKPKDILVCVSHGDPIRLAVAHYTGIPLDMFQRLYVAPASITVLSITEEETCLLSINHEVRFSLTKP